MSKEAEEKVVVNVDDSDVLQDADIRSLIAQSVTYAEREAHFKSLKDALRKEIFAIGDAIGADRIQFSDDTGNWGVEYVRPDPTKVYEKLDIDLLKTNLMKLGKLAAPVVEKIFKASMVPAEPTAAHVRIYPPKEKKG